MSRKTITRRRLLEAAGGVGAVSLAGCLEGGQSDGNGGGDGTGDGGDGNGDDQTPDDGNGGENEDSYAIGMVDSRTGSLAPYGERNERGMQLALEDINALGVGEDERELEVVVEDDETNNQSGVSAAQKLVNQDGVPLLVGSVGSGVSMAIHNSVVKGSDVVQISQNSTGAVLSEEPELLRMSPSGAAKGAALADLISEDGHEDVAVTWINNDYGVSLSEVFAEEFEGNVAYNEPHEPEGSSYRGELTEMADSGASAWLFITYADEVTVMLNQAYELGHHEQVEYYGAESTIADDILENTEPGSQEGFTGITESAPEDQENYQDYRDRFNEEFDQDPTVWSAYTYDALVVSALAIEAADDFTGSALKEVVREVTRPEGEEVFTYEEGAQILRDGGSPSDIDYQGVSGPVDLDENGDPPGFYQIYTVEDHEYVWGDYVTS